MVNFESICLCLDFSNVNRSLFDFWNRLQYATDLVRCQRFNKHYSLVLDKHDDDVSNQNLLKSNEKLKKTF